MSAFCTFKAPKSFQIEYKQGRLELPTFHAHSTVSLTLTYKFENCFVPPHNTRIRNWSSSLLFCLRKMRERERKKRTRREAMRTFDLRLIFLFFIFCRQFFSSFHLFAWTQNVQIAIYVHIGHWLITWTRKHLNVLAQDRTNDQKLE